MVLLLLLTANDLEQRGLTRRSAKHQVPFRRESLWAESKKDEAGYEFSGAGEQAQPGESHDGDYEEEGQAKSEPTTPKSGRASMVTTPQGRSPKNNRNRAEKCVGVHISGPFSVTLPFHITSNLSRLTRGMECPSLSYSSFHRSSERLFSLDGNLFMGSSDTDKVRLTMMSHIDKENSESKGDRHFSDTLLIQTHSYDIKNVSSTRPQSQGQTEGVSRRDVRLGGFSKDGGQK